MWEAPDSVWGCGVGRMIKKVEEVDYSFYLSCYAVAYDLGSQLCKSCKARKDCRDEYMSKLLEH